MTKKRSLLSPLPPQIPLHRVGEISSTVLNALPKVTMESPPSIDSMWELATSRFYDLTGEKLGKRSNTSSTTPIDDLKRTIESRLKGGDQDEKDRDKKAKWAKTKDAGLTILTYIQLLGGVAAQAASTVSENGHHKGSTKWTER